MRTVQNNWPWIIGLTAIGLWSFTTHYQKTERQRLGHLVMQVSDLERSQKFYEDVLHMETKEEVNYNNRKRIFLSSTDEHHELVLVEKKSTERVPGKNRYLQQVAFEMESQQVLADTYQDLQQENIAMDLKDNQISWSIYFYDPDSVQIELYWDIRDEPFGKKRFQGNQTPLSVRKLTDVH